MFKHMLLGLGAASLLVVVTVMPVQAVPLVPKPGPLPESLIVTRGAWEWAWVGPCTDDIDGRKCSFGTENYGFADPVKDAQWTESFTDFHDLIGAFIDFNNSTTKCAAAYFNQETPLCDNGDFAQGIIWQAPFTPIATDTTLGDPSQNLGAEVLWVRASGSIPEQPSSLPEPSSLLLLGAGLLGLAAWRWKHTA